MGRGRGTVAPGAYRRRVDGYNVLAAIVAVGVVRWWWARDDRRRKERAAGAQPTELERAWETPSRIGRLTLTPAAWIIVGLVALVLMSLVNTALGRLVG